MEQNPNTQAVLLLCAYFSSAGKGEAKPLTPTEYGRFAQWLHLQGKKPECLFYEFDEVMESWNDPKGKIPAERVSELLARGTAMGIAMEKWERAGLWVITRGDAAYPKRLKKRLSFNAPPLFFGVGNKELLNCGGLAFVGSRGIKEDDVVYAKTLASKAAMEGINVLSGGAKGVDETAMLAALEAEGNVVGVMADGLLKAAISGKYRSHLMSNNLVLISPYYPEAGFSAGNAMGRNKYIYCLADHAVVVRSDEGKGGTWAGATENLKKAWVPLFVKAQSDASGNQALIGLGARSLDGQLVNGDVSLAEVLTSEPALDRNIGIGQGTYRDLFAEDISDEPVGEETAPPADDFLSNDVAVNTPDGLEATSLLASEYPDQLDENRSPLTQEEVIESGRESISGPDLFSTEDGDTTPDSSQNEELETPAESQAGAIRVISHNTPKQQTVSTADGQSVFVALFFEQLVALLEQQQSIKLSELKVRYPDLVESQLKHWLSLALADQLIERKGKRLEYSLSKNPQ
jgi:predicted Rossmann fold nucleotide-binding protein DprA/Smf involved in DNA uptake